MAAQINDQINFCMRCGSLLARAERFGKLRPVCPACGWVYYADPKVAVAALIEQDGQVFLVRRANDPQRGLWTMPAGFVDAGEDPAEAVVRECLEETGLQVRVTGLLEIVYGQEHPRGAHFLIVYRANIVGGKLAAGDDVDRAMFFPKDALPPLAFAATRKVLGVP